MSEVKSCMGLCVNWEQAFYYKHEEDEYERCYNYCRAKKQKITEKRNCTNCELFENGWGEEGLEAVGCKGK